MLNDQQPFYFATIRKIIASFGTLFDSVYISRYVNNGNEGNIIKSFKVPLNFAPTAKWLDHKREDVPGAEAVINDGDKKTRVGKTLPRMSYELVDIQYDITRKQQTMLGITGIKAGSPNSLLKQLVGSPWNFTFELNIAVKNLNDGFQIIEQILPNFTPSWTLNVKDIPELSLSKDIPVEFVSISKIDTYEGSFEDDRIINFTLVFTVKGYLYPIIKDSSVIKKVIDNLYQGEIAQDKKSGIIIVKVDPIDAFKDDPYEIVTEIYNQDEIDSNGEVL